MKTEHFPSIELCLKLTEAGFPITEYCWSIGGTRICQTIRNVRPDTICPSVMELLDEMPHYITTDQNEYELNIRMNGDSILVMYVAGMGMVSHFYGTLPNALAEMILWLHENNYISLFK